jgi:hypothetical protein
VTDNFLLIPLEGVEAENIFQRGIDSQIVHGL